MSKFEDYISTVKKSPLTEAISSLYEALCYATPGECDKLVELTARLKPFDRRILADNCVSSLFNVSKQSGGIAIATQPVRLIHFTDNAEWLASILQNGIMPKPCRGDSTAPVGVWTNILTDDCLDWHKFAVIFEMPAGTKFSILNDTQAMFYQTVPPEWFISAIFPLGEYNSQQLSIIGPTDENWSDEEVAKWMEDPYQKKCHVMVSDDKFNQLVQQYRT